jgi:hypothetical protein
MPAVVPRTGSQPDAMRNAAAFSGPECARRHTQARTQPYPFHTRRHTQGPP